MFSWLPWFIFVSALAHGGTFFLFNVVYPERASIPAAAPQISVLDPSIPENLALLQQIEAEDPALVAVARELQPPPLMKVAYRPSYQVIRTTPQGLVQKGTMAESPPAMRPLTIIRSVTTFGEAPTPEPKAQPTRVAFSGALSTRALAHPPVLSFPKSTEPLKSAQFLLGVSDRGAVRYAFVQESSGDTAFDSQAQSQLQQLSFSVSPDPILWGFATILWGDQTRPEKAATETASQ